MLQLIEALNGASGFKNLSNAWIWIYSQASITMTDGQGQTVKLTSSPCWLPPFWTINTGTSTDRLLGLQGDTIQEFAGFLSRTTPSGFAPVSGIGVTVGLKPFSANESEFETFGQPVGGSINGQVQVRGGTSSGTSFETHDTGELEIVTHN